ncbi:hypothetical protein FVP46_03985, partial [Mycobacterium tuberculosis]|nr:hypothetical protein [Mycobacterium tuberculosis]
AGLIGNGGAGGARGAGGAGGAGGAPRTRGDALRECGARADDGVVAAPGGGRARAPPLLAAGWRGAGGGGTTVRPSTKAWGAAPFLFFPISLLVDALQSALSSSVIFVLSCSLPYFLPLHSPFY